MEFTILNEKEFNDYALTNCYNSFYQTSSWGNLKAKTGWVSHFVGVKENDQIIAACLLLQKVLKEFSMFYSPRGYLIDFNNVGLLSFFTDEIKKYAKKHHAIFVKIDPYVIYKERDINGQIVEGGIDNTQIMENLKNLGYKHAGFILGDENIQTRWAFALDLEGKTEDDVLKGMESKTRQLIRKNLRNDIKVRELKENEISIFKDIMSHTSERRHFVDRPVEYYRNMLITLEDKAKIYIATINLEDLVNKNKKEIADNNKTIKQKQNDLENPNKKVNVEKTNKKIDELIQLNEKINEKIKRYETFIAEDGKEVVLGGIIYLIYNQEILSLFGGAYSKYMEFYSFYSLHWELIKYAINNGFTKYNFYGISGDFENKDSEMYGIYDFKRGFGGHVEEYIGEFDLVINKFMYFMYNHVFDIYKKIMMKRNK